MEGNVKCTHIIVFESEIPEMAGLIDDFIKSIGHEVKFSRTITKEE